MEFRILGPLEVIHADRALRITPPRARIALAVLLSPANTVVSVDRLVDELWPHDPPDRARAQVHDYVSRLRNALRRGGDTAAKRLETRSPGYVLRVEEDELDVDRFTRLLHQATEERTAGRLTQSLRLFDEADRLWRGDPFTDVPTSPRVTALTASLTEQRVAGLEERYRVALDIGRGPELVAELTSLVHTFPLRERLVAHLMHALYRGGRTAAALNVYQGAQQTLNDELGLSPGSELRRMEADILRAKPHLMPAGAPARTQPLPRPAQLPADLPGFTGRDGELGRLEAAEESGHPSGVRLVHGLAGSGKTALTVRAAHRLAPHFPDGQLFLDMHGFSPRDPPVDPGDALDRILRALGTPGDLIAGDTAERAALFRSRLAGRRMLLVLDNVADEAQVRPLLPGAPTCLTLITSRKRLTEFDATLSLELDVLPATDAATLFSRLIGTAEPIPHMAATDVRDAVELCGRLPLAIRLAAARLRRSPDRTVEDLVAGLRAGPSPRNTPTSNERSPAAAFDLSYRGLSPPARRLFSRLGLLVASEFPAWIGDALLGDVAEEAVEELVDTHLIEPAGRGVTGPRYRMHDLVHLFARQQAVDLDPQTASSSSHRVRHGWLALAQAADDQLPHWTDLDPEPPAQWQAPARVIAAVRDDPMSWFDEEHPHLDGELRGAAEAGEAAVVWHLAQRRATYLDIRGAHEQANATHTLGLRAATVADDLNGQAAMLGLLADTAANRDDYVSALTYGDRALQAYKTLYATGLLHSRTTSVPVTEDVVAPTHGLGRLHRELADAEVRGDVMAVGLFAAETALAQRRAGIHGDFLGLFERACDAFRVSGPPILEAWALKHIGLAYCRRGRVDRGESSMERIHNILRDIGTGLDPTYLGGDLAGIAAAHGRVREARIILQESTNLARLRGDHWSTGRGLITLAQILRGEGDHTAALAALHEALSIWQELGVPDRMTQVVRGLTKLCSDMGDDDAATYWAEWSQGTPLETPTSDAQPTGVDRGHTAHRRDSR